MISKAYEKADFTVIEFTVEDVLTGSSVVHTTTLPATTSSGSINVGNKGDGGIEFDYSDFFQQ
jgi:hypothetical protein